MPEIAHVIIARLVKLAEFLPNIGNNNILLFCGNKLR